MFVCLLLEISKVEAKHLQQQRQRKRKLTDEPEADDVSAAGEQSPQQPEQAKKKAKLSNKEQRMVCAYVYMFCKRWFR